MKTNKASSRLYPIIRAAAAAAVLPVLFIYIMIAKPDYALMNALGHVVVPVAQVVGDVVTWPFRVIANAFDGIMQISVLRAENQELRARLDAALIDKNLCDVAIADNKKLENELNLVKAQPYDAIIADVIHDNSTMGHNTFIINRGQNDGVIADMVVATTDMMLAGVVIDSANNFARVRALTDSDTNIAVRIAGTDVYGFMTGNGSKHPTLGFFSNPNFQPVAGVKLVTSNISGVLPAGLMVGEMQDDTDVNVVKHNQISRVMVLKFNTPQNEYR
ncbi:MAG: rod shape-determining protein MreC [Alphaproteobacteria bacterium]|nr:rod shape-determining protein MreC [Alphaproteobacteria bacterium]